MAINITDIRIYYDVRFSTRKKQLEKRQNYKTADCFSHILMGWNVKSLNSSCMSVKTVVLNLFFTDDTQSSEIVTHPQNFYKNHLQTKNLFLQTLHL